MTNEPDSAITPNDPEAVEIARPEEIELIRKSIEERTFFSQFDWTEMPATFNSLRYQIALRRRLRELREVHTPEDFSRFLTGVFHDEFVHDSKYTREVRKDGRRNDPSNQFHILRTEEQRRLEDTVEQVLQESEDDIALRVRMTKLWFMMEDCHRIMCQPQVLTDRETGKDVVIDIRRFDSVKEYEHRTGNSYWLLDDHQLGRHGSITEDCANDLLVSDLLEITADLARAKRYDDAISFIRYAIDKELVWYATRVSVLRRRLATLHFLKGDVDAAYHISQGTKDYTHHNSAPYHLQLGIISLSRGETSKAREHLYLVALDLKSKKLALEYLDCVDRVFDNMSQIEANPLAPWETYSAKSLNGRNLDNRLTER